MGGCPALQDALLLIFFRRRLVSVIHSQDFSIS